MSRHRFIHLILPTGLSFLLIAVAACGGEAQEEAATPANQAEETSQVAEVEENNEDLGEQPTDPQPKELTDAELISVLASKAFMREHYPVLDSVNDKNDQFLSFFGTPAKYKESSSYSGRFEIEAVNPSECASLLSLVGQLTDSHVPLVRFYGEHSYTYDTSTDGFMSYESVASRAYFSRDKDFPGNYFLHQFVFKPKVAQEFFLNLAANWGKCKKPTYLWGDEPNSIGLTVPALEADGRWNLWYGPNFFAMHAFGSNIEDIFVIARLTGNVLETDLYVNLDLYPSKIFNLSNKRARKLAKAQGIEVEDIDIENLDKYKVTDSTVFPEYKKIENPNYS